MSSPAFRIRVEPSLRAVPSAAWDACAGSGDPFASHAFLSSLEESGSATARTGWRPSHLILEDDGGAPLGVLPCYLKSHSQGEYVFDHSWADAYARAGGDYYPKLQVSIPFTPATGPRFLVRPDADADMASRALAVGAAELAVRSGASSVHITFMPEAEQRLAAEIGYLRRTDQQFHWMNEGYPNFDAFLDALASRKRKMIRRERRDALANGIEVQRLTGRDIKEKHWDDFFAFYMDTGSRKWGRPYLTRSFFSLIGERMADRVLLVMAKRAGRFVAGAINFIGRDALYGRNWGCVEDHPFLHFEVCYYQAIDFAIEKGLKRVEAGAQGAHKLARGYLPRITYSAHWIADPGLRRAVDHYLERERRAVAQEQAELGEFAPYRRGERTDGADPDPRECEPDF